MNPNTTTTAYIIENIWPAVVFCLGAMFVGYVAYEGARRNRNAEAAAAFRAVLKDVILNLRENPSLPSAQIARLNYHAILAEAQQFRPHIHYLRRRGFDKAIAEYKRACEVATESGSILMQFASEENECAREKRRVLDGAVHNLLHYAKQT